MEQGFPNPIPSGESSVTDKKFILPALALAALIGAGGVLAVQPVPATAQAPAPPAQEQQQQRPMRPSHIEGRIAYAKAELKITPAQEADWEKVAGAMRQNDAERRQAFEQARADRGQPMNALQQLERRARFSAERARATDRLLTAFRPLYGSLSEAQKKTADDLLSFHRFHHGRFRRG
jgi:protein CpxP